VRVGRRREFAHFPEFRNRASREQIPDPTALSTFIMSRLDWTEPRQEGCARWLAEYRALLAIRTREIVPRLAGIQPFAASYEVLGPKGVSVEWRLADGARLALLANFAEEPVGVPPTAANGRMLYSSAVPGAPFSAAFFLLPPAQQ
jgi:maltooligosyltrehalose trehalohydrolase